MALDFLPFKPGQVITAEDLNALVSAIQDGSIFTDASYISSLLSENGAVITALDARVSVLETTKSFANIREQFLLSVNQSVVGLSKVPLLDSEWVSIAGVNLSRMGLPVSFIGDYNISGSTLTLNSQLAAKVREGDLLIVKYMYEV